MKKALFGRLDVSCHQDSGIMLPEGFEREARAEFQPTIGARSTQRTAQLNPGPGCAGVDSLQRQNLPLAMAAPCARAWFLGKPRGPGTRNCCRCRRSL